MTAPIPATAGRVWWLVTTPGHRVLVDADPDIPPDAVIRRGLQAMGHVPVVQALSPGGEWFTPSGPIPGDATTRTVWPDRYTHGATARWATAADLDLHHQTPKATS